MQKKPQPSNKSAEAKPQKPATQTVNPSEKLANLLRKEGMITNKLMKAKEELTAVQDEIQQLWDERNKQAEELLSD